MMGGLAYMTGPPGRPLRAGASVNDIMGGMFAAIGILAALLSGPAPARADGEKRAVREQRVPGGHPHGAVRVTGKPAAPMPARISAWAVYDVFDTSDGQLFVGVVSDTQWGSFCREFDLPDCGRPGAGHQPPARGRPRAIHAACCARCSGP